MMRKILSFVCAALLVAGLCGCEKNLFPKIDLANDLEGSWEKVYQEGVQDAGLVIWTFSSINKESQDPFILTIYVSDCILRRLGGKVHLPATSERLSWRRQFHAGNLPF